MMLLPWWPFVLLLQDCLDTVALGVSTAGLPESVATVPGPRSQREVQPTPAVGVADIAFFAAMG